MKVSKLNMFIDEQMALDYTFCDMLEKDYIVDWYEMFIKHMDEDAIEVYLNFCLEGWLGETKRRAKRVYKRRVPRRQRVFV